MVCLLACREPALPPPAASSVTPAKQTRAVTVDRRNLHLGALPAAERQAISALYPARDNAPLWVDTEGRPSRIALDALAVLRGAASEGLDPADYGVDRITGLATQLSASTTTTSDDITAFETALSAGSVRYLRDLHAGRVNPRAIGFRMTNPADEHDFAALVRAAANGRGLADTARELTPPLVLYRALRRTLATYRGLAAADPAEDLPPIRASVKPGQPYAGLAALHRRLVTLGDLPAGTPRPAVAYEGALVDAVKHFQVRHGLAPDGVLGRTTLAALAVPLSRRARQVELALERLRWLPHLADDRFLAVNIPMFQLWGWNTVPENGAPAFGMSVIVGRALDTMTPVFVEQLRHIIFRPYWNVPPSILRSDILPALSRDPDYLARQDMEIVDGAGDEATPVPMTAENVGQLARGALRLRQRRGPKNSLGLVKFVFPNDENVYMHATPAGYLFGRPRRDFSHGCIRVEDPVGLAEWALAGEPGWTRDRIVAAMDADSSTRVELRRPIQVILFYVTAVVMPEDGTVHFADDIYGHDTVLERALARRRPMLAP